MPQLQVVEPPAGTGSTNGAALRCPAFFLELFQDSVTAHAAGGQANATQLLGEVCRVSTVATAADSVQLPGALPGLTVIVINDATNPMQVFGNGTDTIDGIATATGVSQMGQSVVLYICVVAGAWKTEGLANGYAAGLQTVSTQDGVSAAGTNAGSATVLTPAMAYNVTTVGSNAGVKLPASVTGAEIAINNNTSSNNLSVYPAGSDKINGSSSAATVNTNSITIFYCFTAGNWFTK